MASSPMVHSSVQTYLGNILAVSNFEAGPVARLYSLWYEQSAFNDRCPCARA